MLEFQFRNKKLKYYFTQNNLWTRRILASIANLFCDQRPMSSQRTEFPFHNTISNSSFESLCAKNILSFPSFQHCLHPALHLATMSSSRDRSRVWNAVDGSFVTNRLCDFNHIGWAAFIRHVTNSLWDRSLCLSNKPSCFSDLCHCYFSCLFHREYSHHIPVVSYYNWKKFVITVLYIHCNSDKVWA